MAITSYIKTSDPIVLDRLSQALSNISSILQDTDLGKIGTRESHFIMRNLKLSPLGTALNIVATATTPQDALLGTETFDPQMSLRARQLYVEISNLADSRVELSFDPDSDISYALRYANILKGDAPVYASYVYLELYSIYTSVVGYQIGDIFGFSIPELDLILNNLRFISTRIGLMGNQVEVYELLYVVKYIQRAILFIKDGILSILG